MKNLFAILICSLFMFSSCKQNLIEAIQPKPAKNLKEAKSRLVGDNIKWNVGEIYQNNVLFYQRGVYQSKEVDVDIEYIKFRADGVFEILYTSDGLDVSMRWKLDEANNKLFIYDEKNEDYREDWTIEAGSVYEDSFTMTYSFEESNFNGEKTKTNMKINPHYSFD